MTVKVDDLKEADQKMMMQKALEMLSKQQAQVSKKDTKDEDDDKFFFQFLEHSARSMSLSAAVSEPTGDPDFITTLVARRRVDMAASNPNADFSGDERRACLFCGCRTFANGLHYCVDLCDCHRVELCCTKAGEHGTHVTKLLLYKPIRQTFALWTDLGVDTAHVANDYIIAPSGQLAKDGGRITYNYVGEPVVRGVSSSCHLGYDYVVKPVGDSVMNVVGGFGTCFYLAGYGLASGLASLGSGACEYVAKPVVRGVGEALTYTGEGLEHLGAEETTQDLQEVSSLKFNAETGRFEVQVRDFTAGRNVLSERGASSLSRLEPLPASLYEPAPTGLSAGGLVSSGRLFDKIDRNRDGLITQGELERVFKMPEFKQLACPVMFQKLMKRAAVKDAVQHCEKVMYSARSGTNS